MKYKMFPFPQYSSNAFVGSKSKAGSTAVKTGMMIIGGNSILPPPNLHNKVLGKKGRRGKTVVERKQKRNNHGLIAIHNR